MFIAELSINAVKLTWDGECSRFLCSTCSSVTSQVEHRSIIDRIGGRRKNAE